MKQILNRLSVVLVLSILTSTVTFGQTIKRKITFARPVVVNGTLVQKGTYTAKFDDQTNELTISKGDKVIAKAPAKLEDRTDKGEPYFIVKEDADKPLLLMVAFKKNQATIVDTITKTNIAR
jgi:hypothetical protein